MKQPAAILVHNTGNTSILPVSSSITGITSIFQNLPGSAILVLPVFSRIFQYLQYWYYQYFPESSGIYNPHILYQYCRYWKILENTGYTSIADIGR
jgi:hypothetical protein